MFQLIVKHRTIVTILFNALIRSFLKRVTHKMLDILPKVVVAGEYAGRLTETGAKLVDPNGELQAGCPLCAPEADAATGMVAK